MTRDEWKGLLAELRAVKGKALTFSEDNRHLSEAFADHLLTIAGNKRKRLTVLRKAAVNPKLLGFFFTQAKKMLNPHSFATAAAPFRKKGDDAWKELGEREAALQKQLKEGASAELVVRALPSDAGAWKSFLVARLDVHKTEDAARTAAEQSAARIKALGVPTEIVRFGTIKPGTVPTLDRFEIQVAVAEEDDLEILRFLLLREEPARAQA